MFNFIKKYKERNSKTFLEMFPANLHDDVKVVTKLLPPDIHPPHEGESFVVDSGHVQIYSRIYKLKPSDSLINTLTENQKLILSCIYTRHHDGYLREEYLKNILASEKSWTVPFVVMLMGEYVVEIIELIEKNLVEKQTQGLYVKFIIDNPLFWRKVKSRIVNYWYIYYRDRIRDKRDYPGMKIVKIVENEAKIQGFATSDYLRK